MATPARAPVHRPARHSSPKPSRRRAAPPRPGLLQRTGALARARVVAGVEALLHGPGLIAIVFVLLVGVVFANVALLQKNRQITHDAARVSELKRDNATLRSEVAELGSSERIQQVAAERGLVLPAPDAVRYLRSNPGADAVAAAKAIDESTALAAAPVYAPPAYTAPVVPATPTTTSTTPTTPTTYGTTPTYGEADPYASPTGTEIAGTPDAVTDVTAGIP
ncbi:MAG TPA: cell division protein FtsL [Solirubrobacteraceae bacterium]|nr:cell division protein FtsL [Solirubrobacteraceae bacterium]